MMWPSVRAVWLPFTGQLEGVISHFDRCISERVTIAYGVMVEPVAVAMALPMVHTDGRPATREEIAAEWARVKAAPGLGKAGHRAARPLCLLHLTPQGIEAVTWARLDEMCKALLERFPAFASWPADAQLAVLSLAWACGTSFDYPRCVAAIGRQDWATAAAECRIRVPDLPDRSEAQRRHFLAAARVAALGLDPAELFTGDLAAPPLEQLGREALAVGQLALDAGVDDAIRAAWRER
jgi:hypothetical protein